MDLASLAALARDESTDSRGALVSGLTDLFLAAAEKDLPKVGALFGEVVVRMIDELELDVREQLALRVSRHPSVPSNLLLRLAVDEIRVAGPVLERTPALSDQDLATVAMTQSQDHLRALTRRDVIASALATVLIHRGLSDVVVALVRNRGADLSDRCFELLVARARKDVDIQIALAGRPDMPAEAARRLVPFLPRVLRQRIHDSARATMLKEAVAEFVADQAKAQLEAFGGVRARTMQIIEKVAANAMPVDEAVVTVAGQDSPVDLGVLIARVVDMPHHSVVRQIFSPDDSALIVLCRAAGISREGYDRILRMRSKRLKMSMTAVRDAQNRYARMTRENVAEALPALKAKLKG